MKRPMSRLTLLAAALALAGCSLAPDYKVPPVPASVAYRTVGPWAPAQPSDQIPRDAWWRAYREPALDALETRLLASNADLAAALAHYAQARAFVSQQSAAELPRVSATASPTRNRQSDTRPLRGAGSPNEYNAVSLGGEIDYELDLWGRVRNTVAAAKDEAQATKADLASVQLSLEAQLAQSYLQLRGLDRQTKLLNDTVAAFQRAQQLTQRLHDAGAVSGLDVTRSTALLADAKSQLTQNLAQRALNEHAIAVLVGASASDFRVETSVADVVLPPVPVGVPSALLQRRPDIAAAERRVAESNARIGVARAAYFPQITLSAQGGLQSSNYTNFFSAPNFFWSVGPSIAQYLFDGGLRRAQLDAVKAATDEAAARYRGVALAAFQQVEDSLTLLHDLGTALDQERESADAAQRAVELALTRYQRGIASYLDVVQAQTTALSTERSVLDIQTRQWVANVQLVRALGGGWSDGDLDDLSKPEAAPAVATALPPKAG